MNKPTIQPIQRKAPLALARGLKLYLVGSYLHCPKWVTVVDAYDFKKAIRIKDGTGRESIITQDEVITDGELHALRQMEDKKKFEAKAAKYANIVAMWKQGIRKPSEMAYHERGSEKGSMPACAYWRKIDTAKRMGLIV